ncbi:beta-glucan synthesis-associated protein [Saitoella coloradoensis]
MPPQRPPSHYTYGSGSGSGSGSSMRAEDEIMPLPPTATATRPGTYGQPFTSTATTAVPTPAVSRPSSSYFKSVSLDPASAATATAPHSRAGSISDGFGRYPRHSSQDFSAYNSPAMGAQSPTDSNSPDMEKGGAIFVGANAAATASMLSLNGEESGLVSSNWEWADWKEADDDLHDPNTPDPKPGFKDAVSREGAAKLGALLVMILGALVLFIVWPALVFTGHSSSHKKVSTGESLTSHTFGTLGAIRTSMIDPDTPEKYYTKSAPHDGRMLKLVFSDEFNQDGRSFYPGDDQFWEAVDIHYAATNDLEWYDPDQVTTANGTLRLRIDAIESHNLDYRSGMLQSWNKLCYKGGLIEISASLPGKTSKPGFWPGIWTMGNLGRPGYLATTEGVWPYSYDSCDAGITPNQSDPGGLSYLPGQRLNKCTCSGEDHPNQGVGRGAPEIDALEGAADGSSGLGQATQSGQFAPYDIFYVPNMDYMCIYNTSVSSWNGWRGGPFQQALSGVTNLNNDWYGGKNYQSYGFEYKPGTTEGYIDFTVGDSKTWSMVGSAVGPNGNIGQRIVSEEPMSIIMNLGLSTSWTYIDWPALEFPSTMYIDYVRIYQDEDDDTMSLTCDPPGFPTTQYIEDHRNAYDNANLTSWEDAGYSFPQNTLMNGCSM